MKIKREKNINVFNNDAIQKDSYLYTQDNLYSASIATSRQTDEIIKLIKKFFPRQIRIIDIGCGDGKYTIELFKNLSPKLILGIDPAKKAVSVAKKRIKNSYKDRIIFKEGNIYNINKLVRKEQFDLAIIRGVLHHLYNPKKAIKYVSQNFSSVIVLEPNGYNPILKIIEKISLYHRQHEEKSYWPPLLNKWFEERGYKIIEQKFFGMVPYFCPEEITKLLKSIEGILEKIYFLRRFYCGTNLILYRKK